MENKELSGVKGWLLLLVVCLMFVWPTVSLLVFNAQNYEISIKYPELLSNNNWEIFHDYMAMILMLDIILCLTAGYCLWKKKKKSSVYRAILYVWLIGPVSNVIAIIMMLSILGLDGGNVFSSVSAEFIASIIGSGIWTMYLLKSIRVKNTYGM